MASPADIRKQREHIERRLAAALRESGSTLTIEEYKRAIFDGPDTSRFHAYISEALDVFGYDIDNATEEIISLIQDAWNYFPHHYLGGKCPAELVFPSEI